jgi:AcrR family transcriptional regulator
METDRKSKVSWTDAGLRALEADGHNALKAQPLAQILGVTRGSFYWHFADLDDFHSALLVRWRERMFEETVADVMRVEGDPLRSLLTRVLSEPSRLEIAVRSWALVNPKAAEMVDDVDARRVAFLEKLLQDIGCPTELAKLRAQLLNWAYLGFALSNRRLDRAARQNIVEDLLRFGKMM